MRQIFKVEGQDRLCNDPCVEVVICAEVTNLSKILRHRT